MLIYHIAPRNMWDAARAEGTYHADSLAAEGFIHCSTSRQVTRVANTLYKGKQGLVLLVIDPAQLEPELRWEPPTSTAPLPDGSEPTRELFPHLYGPLNLGAVVRVVEFEPGKDGRFEFPQSAG
jgi:uncharacterized protein (DUF952 family)